MHDSPAITAERKSPIWGVAFLIGANVLLFLLMTFKNNSASVWSPHGTTVIQWGGNHAYATIHGEFWRLASYMFVHMGLIHLVFNMLMLLAAGSVAERIFGCSRF